MNVKTSPGSKQRSKSALEGIAIRRMLNLEPKTGVKCLIRIESELLEALPVDCNLTFEVNLALEHMITKHLDARSAVLTGVDD